MNQQLNWQPSNGGESATQNGFVYRVHQSLADHWAHRWCAYVTEPKGIEFNALCSTAEYGKKFCEFFAEAIALSSSTIDVEACAEEIIFEWVLSNAADRPRYVNEIKDIILKHLQPANESSWINVETDLPKKRGFYLFTDGVSVNKELFYPEDGLGFNSAKWTHWQLLPQPPARKEG